MSDAVAKEVQQVQPDYSGHRAAASDLPDAEPDYEAASDEAQAYAVFLYGCRHGANLLCHDGRVLPRLSSFEEAFTRCLKGGLTASGCSYHDDTWNRLFEITPKTYIREDRLTEVLRGVTVKSL
jgi:hypothetical protein